MKNLLIALVVFLVIPALVVWGIYSFSPEFQTMSNGLLSKVPGGIGNYFSSIPTPKDDEKQLVTIANYLISLDQKQAVDKLNLIENDDAATYQNVIRSMVRLDPTKTEKILEEKRRQSLKPNVVQSTLEQIGQEQIEDHKKRAAILQDLSLNDRIKAFQDILTTRIDSFDYIADLATYMTPDKIGEVIPFLDANAIKGIYEAFDETTNMAVKSYLSGKDKRKTTLSHTAQILASKSIDQLIPLLGTTETYTLDDLVSIFEVLGPKRGGEILAKLNDDVHLTSLVNGIKESQMLHLGVDNFTGDLLKSLNIYKSYDDNISELVNIYSQVDDKKTAEVIKRLYWNTGQIKRYDLDNGQEIVISDQQLALDLLQSFPAKKIASVLSYLDNSISTEISTKLALPDL